MKKLTIFILKVIIPSLMICSIIIPNSVYAYDIDEDFLTNPQSYNYTENEFEMIDRRLKNCKSQIKNQSLFHTSQYINTYNELLENKNNIINHIYSMKKLSINELKSYNYTDTQINAIKNYDGSDELSLLASASVTGTLSMTEFKYNSTDKKTKISAKYKTKWNGIPYFKNVDVMAIAIGGSEANFFHYGSSFSCSKVTNSAGTNASKSIHNGAGVSVKFNISDKNNNSVFTSAELSYRAIAGGKVTVAGIQAKYAHWQIVGTTSFSISATGISPSFSIGSSYNVEDTCTRTLSKYI